jgi:non-homologous end joining protein Ku
MALRAYWSGDLAVGTWTIPVQAGKAIGPDPQDDTAMKRLCECHHEPFTRPLDSCPGGMHPSSEAAEERGDEDLTDVVYGVPKEYDDEGDVSEWAVLTKDVLDDISESAKLEDLEVDPGDIVPLDQLPMHLMLSPWYIWPKVEKGKVNKKRLETYAMIVRALEARGLAMVTVWTPRVTSAPKLVAIYPAGDALVMCEMPFRTQVRMPEKKILDHGELEIPERHVEVVAEILTAMSGDFAYGSYTDVTLPLRKRAIAEALEGREITTRERVVVAEPEEDDLLASLEASLAMAKSGAIAPRKADLVSA